MTDKQTLTNYMNVRFSSDDRALVETSIRDELQHKLGGSVEEQIPSVGRIDLSLSDLIIEVKRGDQWMHGVGQLMVYGCFNPHQHKQKRLHLFDYVGPEKRMVIEQVCKQLGVLVTFQNFGHAEVKIEDSEELNILKKRKREQGAFSVDQTQTESKKQKLLSMMPEAKIDTERAMLKEPNRGSENSEICLADIGVLNKNLVPIVSVYDVLGKIFGWTNYSKQYKYLEKRVPLLKQLKGSGCLHPFSKKKTPGVNATRLVDVLTSVYYYYFAESTRIDEVKKRKKLHWFIVDPRGAKWLIEQKMDGNKEAIKKLEELSQVINHTE
jgi:hypothetical protein